MEKQLQMILPSDTFDTPCVPSNLYNYSLDDVIEFKYIKHAWHKFKKEQGFGHLDIGVVPQIANMIDRIQDHCKITNRSDFYSTCGTFGHSIIQKRYSFDYKTMISTKFEKIDAGKLQEVCKVQEQHDHRIFKRGKTVRRRAHFYADYENVIAPTNKYAEVFEISASEIVQIYLCEVILLWKPIHNDNKKFFFDALMEFGECVRINQQDMKQIETN
jgi:hypothetical protein